MNAKKYLKTFFSEKQLETQNYEIEGPSGINLISNDVVIEHIMIASIKEQNQIAKTIMKIDFMNGDVNHFLKHLAQGLVL